jgi:hypothetical protein
VAKASEPKKAPKVGRRGWLPPRIGGYTFRVADEVADKRSSVAPKPPAGPAGVSKPERKIR